MTDICAAITLIVSIMPSKYIKTLKSSINRGNYKNLIGAIILEKQILCIIPFFLLILMNCSRTLITNIFQIIAPVNHVDRKNQTVSDSTKIHTSSETCLEFQKFSWISRNIYTARMYKEDQNLYKTGAIIIIITNKHPTVSSMP